MKDNVFLWLHVPLVKYRAYQLTLWACIMTVGCDVSLRPGWRLSFPWAWREQCQRNTPCDWKSANSRVWRVPATLWAPTAWRVTLASHAAICSESVGVSFCLPAAARLPSGEYVTELLLLLTLFDATHSTMCHCNGSVSSLLRWNLISRCQCQQHNHQWRVRQRQHSITSMSSLKRGRYSKNFSSAPLHHQGKRPIVQQVTSRWELTRSHILCWKLFNFCMNYGGVRIAQSLLWLG